MRRYWQIDGRGAPARALALVAVLGFLPGWALVAQAETVVDGGDDAPLAFDLIKVGEFEVDLAVPRGLWAGREGIYVAGGQGVRLYDARGKAIRDYPTSTAAHCVTVDEHGSVYVGLQNEIAIFDASGEWSVTFGERGREPGQLRYVTAIAVKFPVVYVCDAGARRVSRYLNNGDYASEISGFLVPSPYFDAAMGPDGALHVVDPGRHTLRRYDANLRPTDEWGTQGAGRAGFSGCCNPTNFFPLSDGRFATTEKGIVRFKVYDAEGNLLAHLGPDHFPKGVSGMDLGEDETGRICLLDPKSASVNFYKLRRATRVGEADDE